MRFVLCVLLVVLGACGSNGGAREPDAAPADVARDDATPAVDSDLARDAAAGDASAGDARGDGGAARPDVLEPRVPGVFVAVGDSYVRVSSRDGTTWENVTALDNPDGDADVIRDAAYGNGTFVCINNDRRVFRSPDGASWTEVRGNVLPDDSAPGWVGGVGFANGYFWAAGYGPRVIRSPDGMTWERVYRGPARGAFRTLAVGAGGYIAAGDDGEVALSRDGMTWSRRTGGGGLQSAAYGMGMFVLVGHGMRVAIVRDGATLDDLEDVTVPGFSGVTGSLRGVAYGEGRFYVGGSEGQVAVYDGTNWQVRTNGPGLYGIAYGVDRSATPVVVGATRGEIFTSRDGLAWTRVFRSPHALRSVVFAPAP